jgi:hypothetical protein
LLSSIEVAEPALAPSPSSEGPRVKIVADRAAPVRLREVRQFQITGCLERAEVLARDRYEGPMDQREEIERRLLVQIDAAAVLGMRVPDILAFWEGNDPDPEVAWCTAFLLASWDEPGARPALSTWLESLREAPFTAWLAATDALSASSHPELFDMLAEWRTSSSSILRATAIDVLSQRQISPKGAGIPGPGTDPYLMLAALRAATRSSDIASQPLLDAPFLVATDPGILREEARTRLILGDLRPVTHLHARVDDMPESAASLAVENLALAGDESLVDAAQALIARLPTCRLRARERLLSLGHRNRRRWPHTGERRLALGTRRGRRGHAHRYLRAPARLRHHHERAGELGRVRVPLGPLWHRAARDNCIEFRRDAAHPIRGRRDGFDRGHQYLSNHLVDFAREGTHAREQLVEHDPERPDVRPVIEVLAHAHLLGAHVRGRADHGAGHRREAIDGVEGLAHAKVEDFHREKLLGHAILAVEEDVGGLQIAMNDLGAVRSRERARDLACDARSETRLLERHLPAGALVLGRPDLAHPALADLLLEPVLAAEEIPRFHSWRSSHAREPSYKKVVRHRAP